MLRAALLAAVLVALVLRRSAGRGPDDSAVALLQNQLHASVQQTTQQLESLRTTLHDTMQTLGSQVSGTLADTNRTMGDRLDNTTQLMGDVRQQLGQLKESSQRMIEMGQDISKLQDILQPPKLRGGLGELFLAELLSQILPPAHFRLQYAFRGGETVDAVVLLHTGMVPIDAKFPLENFKRILGTQNEEARAVAKKAFIKDVKVHIDAIASKYIRTDENTFDFALMYVPAENVYYETVIKDSEFGDEMSIFTYALKKRVIPVSPNSFYAYLQTIILGLKGMRVEERSREIVDNLSRLQKEFDNFAEAFRLVGQHLENSTKKFAEAQKRFDRIEAKVEQIDGLTQGLEAGVELPLLPGPGEDPAAPVEG
jgi:DNA recombination protein RmuC